MLVVVLVRADSDDHSGSGGQGQGWTSIKRASPPVESADNGI